MTVLNVVVVIVGFALGVGLARWVWTGRLR